LKDLLHDRQAACSTCAGRYRRVKVPGIDNAIAANHAFRSRNTNAEGTIAATKVSAEEVF